MPDNIARRRDLKRVVPLTRLRRLYKLLRDTSSPFHAALATELISRPHVLLNMVTDSVKHFGLYENSEAFVGDNRPAGELTAALLASDTATSRLTKALKFKSFTLDGTPNSRMEFLGYELYLNRTSHSECEDESSANGVRVDLLMQDCCGDLHLPVIGEVKVATPQCEDANAFLALIQGLMYAVELLTVPQRARLMRHYPTLAWNPAGPFADLYLILIDCDETADDWRAKLRRSADDLAKVLMGSKNVVSSLLRRIVCLNATLEKRDGNDFAQLETLFAYPKL